MSEATCCFSFNQSDARRAFKGIGLRDLLLAVLAGVQPRPSWRGCLVLLAPEAGPPPGGRACLVVEGAAAGELAAAVAGALERCNVPVELPAARAGEGAAPLARVLSGRWEVP